MAPQIEHSIDELNAPYAIAIALYERRSIMHYVTLSFKYNI